MSQKAKEGREGTAKERLGKMRGFFHGNWEALSEKNAQAILDAIDHASSKESRIGTKAKKGDTTAKS